MGVEGVEGVPVDVEVVEEMVEMGLMWRWSNEVGEGAEKLKRQRDDSGWRRMEKKNMN